MITLGKLLRRKKKDHPVKASPSSSRPVHLPGGTPEAGSFMAIGSRDTIGTFGTFNTLGTRTPSGHSLSGTTPACSSEEHHFQKLYSSSPVLNQHAGRLADLHITPFDACLRQDMRASNIAAVQEYVTDMGIEVTGKLDNTDIYTGILGKRCVIIKKQKFTALAIHEVGIQRMLSDQKIFANNPGYPHIVQFIDHMKISLRNVHLIVMEYCELDTLLRLVANDQRQYLSNGQIFQFAKDLALGLQFMHTLRVAHRDIKLENLLLTPCPQGTRAMLKICDFGFSSVVTPTTCDRVVAGSPRYFPPEISESNTEIVFPITTDLWAFGVSLFGMFEGIFPITNRQVEHNLLEMKSHHFFPFNHMREHATFRDLIERLLVFDPHDRISINEVLKSDFFIQSHPIPTSPAKVKEIHALAKVSISASSST